MTPGLQVRGPGEQAQWNITIGNAGGRTADGTVTITDVLGDDFDMGSITVPVVATLNGNVSGVISGNTITWSGVTLEAGEVVTFTLRANTKVIGNEGRLSNTLTVGGVCAGGCIYSTVSTEAYVGYTNITKTIVPTTATIGETVPVSITSAYFGAGSTYTNVVITDTLPAGLAYVSGTARLNGVSREPDSTAGGVLTFNLGSVPGSYGTQSFTIDFDMVVSNVTANNNNDIKTNTASTTYTVNGNNFTDSATDSIRLTEAVLVITKNENDPDNVVYAGQSLLYTVTAYHHTTSTADAHDLVVTDVVPAGLTVNTGTISDGGTYNAGTRTITWTLDTLTLAAGTKSFTYTAVVDATDNPNQALTNNTHLTWTSLHDSTPGEHPERRNGTGTSPPNDYFSDTTNTVTVETNATIAKTPDSIRSFPIGSTAPYTVTVTLPRAVIPTLSISDLMGAGIYYKSGNTTITLPDGSTLTTDPSIASGPNNGTAATTLRWSFTNLNAVSGNPVVITFTATMANVTNNQDGTHITNRATYDFTDYGGAHHTGSDSGADLIVLESVLSIGKSRLPAGNVYGGQALNYTLTIAHTVASHATGYDLVVTDVIPAGLTLNVASIAGGDTNSYNAGTRTITWTINTLNLAAPGNTATLTYSATVDNSVTPNQALTNNCRVTWTSISGANSDERNGTGIIPPNDYFATNSSTARGEMNAVITKTLTSSSTATIGDGVTYRINVTLPRVTIPALTITETIGGVAATTNGIRYLGASFVAPGGGTITPTTTTISSPNDGTARVVVTWTFSNFPGYLATATDRDLIINVTADVPNVVQNQNGDVIPNTATCAFTNATGTLGASSASVTLTEPNLTVNKSHALVSPATVIEAGATLEYTLSVTNNGTSTAHNVVVTDTVASKMNSLTWVSGGDSHSISGNAITYTITSIAAGGSVTLRYRVTLDDSVNPNEVLTNNVTVTWESLASGAERRTGPDTNLANDYVTTTSDSVRVSNAASIAKTPDSVRNVTILSTVPYTITMGLPKATVPALTVTENLSAGLTYRPNSARVTYPANPGSPVGVEPTWSGPTDGTGTSTLTWNFSGLDASSGNALIITLDAVVADIEQNKDGDNIPNSATATGASLDFGGGSSTGTDTSADIHLMIPAFRTTKGLVSVVGCDGTDHTADGAAEPGDTVTYTFTILNIGSGDAENVAITDTLPLYFTFVSTDRPGSHWDPSTRVITWDPVTLPGNGSITARVVASVTHDLIKQGTTYTNVVHVAGNDILGNAIPGDNSIHFPIGTVSNDTADYTITTGHVPAFIVDKSIADLNGTPVNPGDPTPTIGPGEYADYSVVVTNVGDGTAYNVNVSDTLPTGLQYGAPAPERSAGSWTDASWGGAHPGTHHANPAGTTGTIVWDSAAILGTPSGIVLSPGASLTLTYRIYANSEIIHLSTIINYVEAWGNDCSGSAVIKDRHLDIPADTNATDSSRSTMIGRLPFLVTDKIVTAIDGSATNTTVAVVDSIIDYQVTVTNVGLSTAYHLNVYDTLPIGFEYVTGSCNFGEPNDISGRDLTWNLDATLPVNDTLTLTFQARVTSSTTGGKATNHVWVEAQDGNSQPVIKNGHTYCPADTDARDAHDVDVTVDIPKLPQILTKVANPRGVGPGSVVHYTVSFTNRRKISLFDATITDTMPTGFRYKPGTTLINGKRAADPAGNNPYIWTIGTIAPESVTTLDYYVLVSQAAKLGANVNTAVLSAHDGAGKPLVLTANAVVVVRGPGFPEFETFRYTPRSVKPAGPELTPARPVKAERPIPNCCLHVNAAPVRSQDFGDTVPGYPEIYYQTDIAMYAATELFMTKKRLTPWLEAQGIDPERRHLMTGLYNRMVEKLGEYAEFNLGNVVMESTLGIPLSFAPGIVEEAKKKGTSPANIQAELLRTLAARAGLTEAPKIQPIYLEYFGSYPYLADRIAKDKLAWEERLMDKNIMPAALGFTLLREASQIDTFLASGDATERFFGWVLLTQAIEKTKSISTELARTAGFPAPTKYLPHFSRIAIDNKKTGLTWRTTDDTSTLYDHASVLWGLSKMRSVILHSSDPTVRSYLPEVTRRMDEVYRAIDSIHYDRTDGTFSSIRKPGGTAADRTVTAKDLGFVILALRSVFLENRDLSLDTIDPKRKITAAADFMIDKLMAGDGGIYTAYNYADSSPVVGAKRTLVDNALAVRALLSAYVVTGDRKYRTAALDVYAFMVKKLWLEDLRFFADEENPDYEVVLTPQSIGALIGALRELTLFGDTAERQDYLDRMSYTTDRILDQAQLQLYENRFFPWHAPITIVPDDPNGRSYVKPIITTIRSKGITYDLAPILVRKMVLNITPAGAIASGNEEAVSDWNKWKANLHYEVPDIIASALIDNTFVTDEGMYFTSLMHDYRRNLGKDLPSFNPYDTDPGIPVYAEFVSDEVSRYNVENLTLNSGMGVKLSESELVRRLAANRGTSPDRFMEDFVNKHAPKVTNGAGGFRDLVDTVKRVTGLGGPERFNSIIYLEYASGKPYYSGDIERGWDASTFDKSLATSSAASAMVRQIMFIMDRASRSDLSVNDRFALDAMILTVAAKHMALTEVVSDATDTSVDVPHGFTMSWDETKKRHVPRITDKKGSLLDEVFLIWAESVWIEARDRGLFNEYRAYLGDSRDDEKLMAGLIDSLMKDHYDALNGTLVTGSVNAVEVGRALDILTRAADAMKDGPAKDRLVGLIKHQADFITGHLVTDTGIRAVVGLGNEKIPGDLCRFECLGTNVFPILALYRTWEVTGDEKYLKAALGAFARFDKTKWDQELGLYLSNGTIYTAPDRTKLELYYTNQELIAAILLISKVQPHLTGEDKILSAYHMTTFMNRIMEIASVERYPGNSEPPRTVFSPEIIRSVKIILSDSRQTGKPGDVFTYRIVIDNDCVGEVERTLSRIRVEEALPDGLYYVPGSTRVNGAPGPDPIGRKTLSWYYPALAGGGRIVIDYQVVADKNLREGVYRTGLSVRSLSGYGGKLSECGTYDVGIPTVVVKDLWPVKETQKRCVPCDIGRKALAR